MKLYVHLRKMLSQVSHPPFHTQRRDHIWISIPSWIIRRRPPLSPPGHSFKPYTEKELPFPVLNENVFYTPNLIWCPIIGFFYLPLDMHWNKMLYKDIRSNSGYKKHFHWERETEVPSPYKVWTNDRGAGTTAHSSWWDGYSYMVAALGVVQTGIIFWGFRNGSTIFPGECHYNINLSEYGLCLSHTSYKYDWRPPGVFKP
jgi:hypothetical protein